MKLNTKLAALSQYLILFISLSHQRFNCPTLICGDSKTLKGDVCYEHNGGVHENVEMRAWPCEGGNTYCNYNGVYLLHGGYWQDTYYKMNYREGKLAAYCSEKEAHFKNMLPG